MTEGNMSVYKYKAFKSGSKVSRLIIFLHGYNSCIEDVEPFAEMHFPWQSWKLPALKQFFWLRRFGARFHQNRTISEPNHIRFPLP